VLVPLGLALLPGPAERTPLSVPLPSAGFERIRVAGGVTVYKDPHSDIIRLAAESRFPAPPERVLQALLDYRRQVGTIARLSEARVLVRGRGWLEVYQRLNLPVISDRDFTLLVRWGEEPQSGLTWVAYHAESARAGPRERSGVVRVTHHAGSWQLVPVEGGRATFVRFQVSIDLGGWLPKWMARSGAGREVPELFAALGRLVEQTGPNVSRARGAGNVH